MLSKKTIQIKNPGLKGDEIYQKMIAQYQKKHKSINVNVKQLVRDSGLEKYLLDNFYHKSGSLSLPIALKVCAYLEIPLADVSVFLRSKSDHEDYQQLTKQEVSDYAVQKLGKDIEKQPLPATNNGLCLKFLGAKFSPTGIGYCN
jgi:predicted DNA binding CopG/RHH family protein